MNIQVAASNASTFAGTVSGTVIFNGLSTDIIVYYTTSIGIVYVVLQFQYTDNNLIVDVNLLYTKECTSNLKASGMK